MTNGNDREDDIMNTEWNTDWEKEAKKETRFRRQLLEGLCERNNIEIETSQGDGVFEVELVAPEGYCFDTDLRYLVEEQTKEDWGRDYRQRAYRVSYSRLLDYLPLKEDKEAVQ